MRVLWIWVVAGALLLTIGCNGDNGETQDTQVTDVQPDGTTEDAQDISADAMEYPVLAGDLTCLGQWQAPTPPDPLEIGGTVTELLYDDLVANVNVQFFDAADTLLGESVTDADGAYRVTGLGADFPFDAFYIKLTSPETVEVYRIDNRLLGYDLNNYEIVTLYPNTRAALLAMIKQGGGPDQQPGLGIVSGQLIDCEGNSISGATVAIDPPAADASVFYRHGTMEFVPAGPGIATHADFGAYALLNVPPGEYTVKIFGTNDATSEPTEVMSASLRCFADGLTISYTWVR